MPRNRLSRRKPRVGYTREVTPKGVPMESATENRPPSTSGPRFEAGGKGEKAG
jgi:hypothetical protein